MALTLTTQATPDQITSIVNQAADKYHVPRAVMWGMFSNETNLGQNIATSSTGAMGPFQFMPATARSYGYPMTNNPTPTQWALQATAAARYLSDLNRQTGSWQNALAAYFAGPGGVHTSGAQAYAKKALDAGAKVIGQGFSTAPGGSIGDVPQSLLQSTPIGDAAQAIHDVWNALTTPKLWIRILKFLGGALAIFWALKELTGSEIPALKVSRA